MLHYENEDDVQLTNELMELEAETVAYIVMDRFCIEIESDKYLALYKKTYNLMASLERIKEVVSIVLKNIK